MAMNAYLSASLTVKDVRSSVACAERAKGEGMSLMLTTENVDDLAAQAKAHGATLDTEPADMGGRRAFRRRDPDGFRLTIATERRA